MIVVVTGTSGLFARLSRSLEQFHNERPEEQIWVQHGEFPLPEGLTGIAFERRDLLIERMRAAKVVVCHAGSGALLDALSTGHKPVVFPRLARYDEIVNDHQLELVDALTAEGRIIAVPDGHRLAAYIDLAREERSATVPASGRERLIAAVRCEVSIRSGGRRTAIIWRLLQRITNQPERHAYR